MTGRGEGVRGRAERLGWGAERLGGGAECLLRRARKRLVCGAEGVVSGGVVGVGHRGVNVAAVGHAHLVAGPAAWPRLRPRLGAGGRRLGGGGGALPPATHHVDGDDDDDDEDSDRDADDKRNRRSLHEVVGGTRQQGLLLVRICGTE